MLFFSQYQIIAWIQTPMIVILMPPASTTEMELTPVNVTTLLLAMEYIVKVCIYMWINISCVQAELTIRALMRNPANLAVLEDR